MKLNSILTSLKTCHHQRTLCLFDFTIKVSCQNDTDLTWLKEFFCPQFDFNTIKKPSLNLSLLLSDEIHRRLKSSTPEHSEKTVGFILDTNVIYLEKWKINDDFDVLFNANNNIYYLTNGYDITIVATETSHHEARIELMRVIREYASNYLVNHNAYVLHAAAFSLSEQGILIAGLKNQGKTSLMLYFTSHGKTKYIANDRAFILFHNSKPYIYGMPTIFSYDTPGLNNFPKSMQVFSDSMFRFNQTIAESKNEKHDKKPNSRVIGMTPTQLCALQGLPSTTGIPLKLILAPTLNLGLTDHYFEKCFNDSVALALLERARLSQKFTHLTSCFSMEEINNPDHIDYETYIQTISRNTPIYKCHFGKYSFFDKTLFFKLENIASSH